MSRILLVASTTGYQVREFSSAAARSGVDLVLATDRCHVLPDPWGDRAVPVRFEDPQESLSAIEARGPFDGVLAVGDQPALIAAQFASRLGLRFSSPDAVRAAGDKYVARTRFRSAGMNVPAFEHLTSRQAVAGIPFPCVLKPLRLSASRGVIRADNPREFAEARDRIRKILADSGDQAIIVEQFIPGREFALEGVLSGGNLKTLAIFDKPDPLNGPFFEETIYVTPSRESAAAQTLIRQTAQQAARALGLTEGPLHAEMRVNDSGVFVLEAAARPIGGLCARGLRFATPSGTVQLEELLLRHALGEDLSSASLAPGGHGVMMIPIPQSGVYQGVSGTFEAFNVPGIEDVIVTAKEGQAVMALPESASYLGFIFARTPAGTGAPAAAEAALRAAHAKLKFRISTMLPVVG